jgi:tRNA(Ile)-lysidine synthase
MRSGGAKSLVSAFAEYDGPLVVALSGGADSAVAAWAAHQTGMAVRCLHIDHGLPGSPVMREAAAEIASRLGVDLGIEVVDVRSSSETDLRDARYVALLASLGPDELLVTAHTADDTVETMLINLLRGTGVGGLAGIPARRDRIVRPLLGFSREDVRGAASREGLPFVDDPENLSSAHLRNRVRHELLPYLESDFQPAIRQLLGRLAGAARDAWSLIDRQVSTVPLERSTHGVRASIGRLSAVPPEVRRQVYRLMLVAMRGPTLPSAAEVDRMEAVFVGSGVGEFDGTDATAVCDGPWLVLGVRDADTPLPAQSLVDGMAWGSFRFRFVADTRVAMLSRWQLVTTERSLVVRAAQPSDTIEMRAGSKEVDAAISERGYRPRRHAVVVDATDEVIWIPGVRHRWAGTPFSVADAKGYLVVVADREQTWAPFVR